MPLLAGALAFVMQAIAVHLVVRTLFALGLGITTFVGATELIDYAHDQVQASYAELPATISTLMGILKVDYAISIMFAALTFRVTYGLATRFGPRLPGAGQGA
mgnify:CR=1 FL=1